VGTLQSFNLKEKNVAFGAVEESAVLFLGDQLFVGWDVWSLLTCALFFLLQHWSYQVGEAAGSVRVQPSLQIRSRVLSFCSPGTDLSRACK